MTFATNLSDTASILLTTYGEAVSCRRDVVDGFITSTGEVIPGTPVTYSGYGHPSLFTNTEIDNVVVLQGDIKLILYTTTLPLVEDIITLNTVDYTIKQVRAVRAQGSDIIYILVLRQ